MLHFDVSQYSMSFRVANFRQLKRENREFLYKSMVKFLIFVDHDYHLNEIYGDLLNIIQQEVDIKIQIFHNSLKTLRQIMGYMIAFLKSINNK